MGIKGAPDWVNKGSQALKDDGKRLIYGIGSAPSMNDLSLQTSTADDRARAEVARVLSTFMHVVSQDYGAVRRHGPGSIRTNNPYRDRSRASPTRTSAARRSRHTGEIRRTGTIWSLVKLDMNNVKAMVASSDAMNASFKNYFTGTCR